MTFKSKRKKVYNRNKKTSRRRKKGKTRKQMTKRGGMKSARKPDKSNAANTLENRLEAEAAEAEAEAEAEAAAAAAAAAAVPIIPKEITGLALPLGNLMYEHNLANFNSDHHQGLQEYNINMVGPDFDSIPHKVEQFVLNWQNNPKNKRVTPPWSEYIGKLCEVPRGFFANNERRPARNLYDVKNNPANFNSDFARDPTNANIVEIPIDILGLPQNGVARNSEGQHINPGKYKFVLMKNDEIRYIPDTGNRAPYYYFPSIMLYFYNIEVITLEELKQSLGNELPHSLLFDAKLEKIMSGGDFTINKDGYLVKASGYSGHIKPNPSNVYLAMQRFINMGYPLDLTKNNSYESRQTGNTERANNSERLFGTYLRIEFDRPQVPALVEAAAAVV